MTATADANNVDDPLLAILEGRATAAIAEEPAGGLDIIDWHEAYAGVSHDDAIVDGLVFAGRWLAIAAPAKAGKSTVALTIAACLATGRDPFTGTERTPVSVLYLDAEMGRVDVVDRLRDDLQVDATDLHHLHYTDLVPPLNQIAGAAKVHADIQSLGIEVVIVDGLNGAVIGPEKDDETWRPLYDLTIAGLKRQGIAVVTCDNLGKDKTLGPRGSSVKVDKPDAVILLERTDAGVKFKTTHRRTAAYPLTTDLTIHGIDGDQPLHFRYSNSSWPAGVADKARELDQAGVPTNTSTRQARELLKAHGTTPGNNTVLGAAIRYRKSADYMTRIALPAPGITAGSTPTRLDRNQ